VGLVPGAPYHLQIESSNHVSRVYAFTVPTVEKAARAVVKIEIHLD
jgi:hypothetical protein